jgi:hypothetical protein
MFVMLFAAGLAAAQPTVSTRAVGVAAPASQSNPASERAMPSADDFAKMLKLFDKMFPAQPDPDPTRLAKARGVALSMWPDGTYGSLIETLATTVGNSVLDMKPSDLPMPQASKAKKGKSDEPKAAQPDISLRDQMRRDDPYFDKRMEVVMAAAHRELQRLSPLVEPTLREGLSRALARRFSEPQLADIGAFYASPTGQLYARESMKMWMDGDIARSMMNSMPMLIMQMPGAFERIKAANDTLPPPPRKAKPAN